jgi:uncharacterized membrane protein
MKKARLFLAAAVLLGLLEALHFRPHLPEWMATHFDATGRVDGWGARDRFLLGFALLPVLLVGVAAGVRPLLRRLPDSLINMPNKDYWLAPERRERTFERMGGFVEGLAAMALFLLDAQLYLALQAASAPAPALSVGPLWGTIALFVAGSVAWFVAVNRGFRRPAVEP